MVLGRLFHGATRPGFLPTSGRQINHCVAPCPFVGARSMGFELAEGTAVVREVVRSGDWYMKQDLNTLLWCSS